GQAVHGRGILLCGCRGGHGQHSQRAPYDQSLDHRGSLPDTVARGRRPPALPNRGRLTRALRNRNSWYSRVRAELATAVAVRLRALRWAGGSPGGVAQLAERPPFKRMREGSSPSTPTLRAPRAP